MGYGCRERLEAEHHPVRRLGFASCANRFTATGLPDARSQRLVKAVYEALAR